MYIYKGYIINAICTADPGVNETISGYIWKLDTLSLPDNTQTIQINTSTLAIGEHIISAQATNSCGNVSEEATSIFNLVEVNNMQKTVSILVGEPTVNTTVIMDLTATVNVTVKDPNNVPLLGAVCAIGAINGTTDATGLAILSNVPYGTRDLIVTYP